MKKLVLGIIAMVAFMMTVVGCKSIPSVDDMTKVGTASGYTAAYVLNKQVKVDDATRNAIINIMTEVEKYIPSTNETFVATWTPIAQKYVDKLVAEDKITKTVADRVIKDFGYIVGLLDAYVDKKGIRQYQDLVNAFIHSFCDSFLTHFKPANGFAAGCNEFDDFTYNYMMKTAK